MKSSSIAEQCSHPIIRYSFIIYANQKDINPTNQVVVYKYYFVFNILVLWMPR